MRFEGPLNVDLNEITTNLVPFPRLHFLVARCVALGMSSCPPAPSCSRVHVRSSARALGARSPDCVSVDLRLLMTQPGAPAHGVRREGTDGTTDDRPDVHRCLRAVRDPTPRRLPLPPLRVVSSHCRARFRSSLSTLRTPCGPAVPTSCFACGHAITRAWPPHSSSAVETSSCRTFTAT